MKIKKRKINPQVCDLHSHSYYSDGQFSPKELVRKAKKAGIKVLALTDHNSVNGINEAIKEGDKVGVRIIPGAEFRFNGGEILGYFIDYRNKNLHKDLKDLSSYVNKRMILRLRMCKKLGYDISVSKFRKMYPYSKGNYEPGNLLNYFVGQKKMSWEEFSEIISQVDYLIKKGKEKSHSMIYAIKLVKKYGGVPVLAHPWIGEYSNRFKFNEKNINKWVKAGLKGLEVDNGEGYHFGRTPEFVRRIRKYAKKYNLILTKGSDFHGPLISSTYNTHILGKSNCSLNVIKKLEKLKDEQR